MGRESLSDYIGRMEAELRSEKNARAFFGGKLTGLQLVYESKCLQPGDDTDNLREALRLDSAVDFSSIVADAEDLEVGTGRAVRVGFFSDQGQYFLIYAGSVFSVNDLCEHGHLPKNDIAGMGYALKYLRSAVRDAS